MRRTAILLLLLAVTVRADEPRRDHAITVDDYFSLATILESAISPDGKQVAYTDARWQLSTDDRKADLWVVSTGSAPSRRLTFDRAGDRALRWSADSRTIFFLANRKREAEKKPPYDGSTQVWRIDADGGSPVAVTRVEGGVTMYDLARDGKSLWYVTDRDRVEAEWKAMRQQYSGLEYGHGVTKISQVTRLDLGTWRSETVIDDGRHIRDLAVAPGARRVAMITAPDDKVLSFEGRSRVDVWDAGSKAVAPVPDRLFRADAASPYGWLENLAWSHDGRTVAFNIVFDAYPAEIIVASWGGEEVAVRKVKRPAGLSVKGYGSPIAFRGTSNELYFLGEEKARLHLCAVRRSGDVETVTKGDMVVQQFSFSENGEQAAVLANSPTTFEDLSLLTADGRTRRLTNVNPQTQSWKLPKLSVVSWKGADGAPVEGVLELPPDAKPGEKLPLVLAIHGGPTTADLYHLQYWIYGRTLLPSRGYAVLCPNYRGSTGYGDKFLTDLIGHENDRDVNDILRGVDVLLEMGIADPNRLGVSGWSNGGYLTNCLITKTTRFKAASSGAGIVDTVMEWGANDEPAYAMAFKKGLPWAQPDLYRKTSPTYALDKVRTPTLIHVGANDERCPPGHSRMLYRALKEYVNVPTELIVYPGESHGIMKAKHRRAKMEWDLAWFDRHVLGKTAE